MQSKHAHYINMPHQCQADSKRRVFVTTFTIGSSKSRTNQTVRDKRQQHRTRVKCLSVHLSKKRLTLRFSK